VPLSEIFIITFSVIILFCLILSFCAKCCKCSNAVNQQQIGTHRTSNNDINNGAVFQLFNRQITTISYETALRNSTLIEKPEIKPNEMVEFNLPTYEEYIKKDADTNLWHYIYTFEK